MKLLFPLEKRPYRHSYSSIKKYKECPRAYALEYLQGIRPEPNAAMMRGSRMHKLAEDYMGNTDAQVPYDIRKVGLTIFQLRQKGALPEATWLLKADWTPTDNQGEAKIKAIVDIHYENKDVLYLHDYKSGREYPGHADQLEFYAIVGLQRFPHLRRAESSAIYFDTGREGAQRSIIRAMLPKLQRPWQDVIIRMDDDREYLPHPGTVCGRCSFASSKGGPCDAWRKAA